MKTISKAVRVLALAALVTAGATGQAAAATITLVPGTQTVGLGPVLVDIMLGDLTSGDGLAHGGFSFLLGYNPAILAADTFTADPDGEFGAGMCVGCSFAAGVLDLFFSTLEDPADEALFDVSQGTSFRLATVRFNAIAPGLSPLTFSLAGPGGAFLSNWDGSDDLSASAIDGEVCVVDQIGVDSIQQTPCDVVAPIPEPGTLALFGTGVGLALVAVRRRRAAGKARA